MADQRGGGIKWCDETWNPIRGCSRVSAGCVNCYAESVAHRFNAPGLPYEGLTKDGRWNGTVRLVPDHLADPLRWQKPRKIFVNSMSDLFHESLDAKTIATVFGIMAAASRHTFQVLTKRPGRMRRWFDWIEHNARSVLFTHADEALTDAGEPMFAKTRSNLSGSGPWPLPNVWLGVSVEDQKTADARIPILLDTPAAVRFVSYEPALGPVDFARWVRPEYPSHALGVSSAYVIGEQARWRKTWGDPPTLEPPKTVADVLAPEPFRRLSWIIVGGESGPRARPFDVGWARSTVKQCVAARVACFVKQMGSVPVLFGGTNASNPWPPETKFHAPDENTRQRVNLNDSHGADPAEWPASLRVQEFPR